MTQDRNNGQEGGPDPRDPAVVEARRRRLVLGGMSAPLVLTFLGRPVWAQTDHCTPSALASADVSGLHDFSGCSRSAGFWRNHQDLWPDGSGDGGTASVGLFSLTSSTEPEPTAVHPRDPFVATFGEVPYHGGILYAGMTLGEVIGLSGVGGVPNPGNLGLPLVGAYVNAVAFPGPRGFAYTPNEIKRMYGELALLEGEDRLLEKEAERLKDTLDQANNQYDSSTSWP
ncbi:hypothetical protein [Ectothiorhodospira mobilis]|uniref:hypothetical protein n=1 Tax=Ectothiorhodospira mobilis TaxID=195064 RepID=UPI001EE9499D|nr:hypothetical protein [Ectothiorhodospira mobilis]MCG5534451.1 hypothetical protein [Ectothiorhodospira mobilis]